MPTQRPAQTDEYPAAVSDELRATDRLLGISQEYVSATNTRGDPAANACYAMLQEAIERLERAQEGLE